MNLVPANQAAYYEPAVYLVEEGQTSVNNVKYLRGAVEYEYKLDDKREATHFGDLQIVLARTPALTALITGVAVVPTDGHFCIVRRDLPFEIKINDQDGGAYAAVDGEDVKVGVAVHDSIMLRATIMTPREHRYPRCSTTSAARWCETELARKSSAAICDLKNQFFGLIDRSRRRFESNTFQRKLGTKFMFLNLLTASFVNFKN